MKSDIYESNSSNNNADKTNQTSSTEDKNVKTVKVRVTIDDNDLALSKKEYEATDTIIESFTGRNTVKVKVYIDGDWKNREEYIFDLNEKTDIRID